jgi:hypothetical protein
MKVDQNDPVPRVSRSVVWHTKGGALMYASITNVQEFLKWRSFRQPHGLAAVAIAAIGPGTRGRLCSQLSDIAAAPLAASRIMCRDRL